MTMSVSNSVSNMRRTQSSWIIRVHFPQASPSRSDKPGMSTVQSPQTPQFYNTTGRPQPRTRQRGDLKLPIGEQRPRLPSTSVLSSQPQVHHLPVKSRVTPVSPQPQVHLPVESRVAPVSPLQAILDGSVHHREIPLLHRLVKTHNVWYVPEVDRVGATQLLQGAQFGNFIVRQSSRRHTMALSVHAGKHCDHYIIECSSGGMLHIEGSKFRFPALPLLICHYCEHQLELRYKLCLPSAIISARTDRELLKFNLSGRDFWRTLNSTCNRNSAASLQQMEPRMMMSSSAVIQMNGSTPDSGTDSIPEHQETVLEEFSSADGSSCRVRVTSSNSSAHYENMWTASTSKEKLNDDQFMQRLPPRPKPRSNRQQPQITQGPISPGAQAVRKSRSLQQLPNGRSSSSTVTSTSTAAPETPAGAALEHLETALRDLQHDLRHALTSVNKKVTQHQMMDDEDGLVRQRPSPCQLNLQMENSVTPVQMRLSLRRDRPKSEYDNLLSTCDSMELNGQNCSDRQRVNSGSSSGTVFCKPWDSTVWGQLLQPGMTDSLVLQQLENLQPEEVHELSELQKKEEIVENGKENSNSVEKMDCETVEDVFAEVEQHQEPQVVSANKETNTNPCEVVVEQVELGDDLSAPVPLLSSPRLAGWKTKENGREIRNFIFGLLETAGSSFTLQISEFIECTKKSSRRSPRDIMRNIRQFITGMKNYLTRQGEQGLKAVIDNERKKLAENEYLNVDAILELTLHKIIIKPLKPYIYQLMEDSLKKSGALEALSTGIQIAANIPAETLCLHPDLRPLNGSSLEHAEHFLHQIEASYSPLKKLEAFIAVVSQIYNVIGEVLPDGNIDVHNVAADDFLVALVWTIATFRLNIIELEADFMECLLQPSLLNSEVGYYLTALQASVQVLKDLSICQTSGEDSDIDSVVQRLRADSVRGTVRVVTLDELRENLQSHVFPVRPHTTSADLSSMVAHRLGVPCPADCGLYVLSPQLPTAIPLPMVPPVADPERRLADSEKPYQIREATVMQYGKPCLFLYRRDNVCVSLPPGFN